MKEVNLVESLRDLVGKRAESLGIELRDSELRVVLGDLARWYPKRKGEDHLIRTQDGSLTLWSGEFGEPYHSVSAGAIREALEKFVLPSRITEKAVVRGKVRILDVGFGLGYNLAVALRGIREANPKAEIEIISLERRLPENVPLLPEPYRRFHETVLNLLPEGERDGIYLKVLLGDGRERLRGLYGFGADAVFHDPFSPYRNPEMWSLEFLRIVRDNIKPEGYWVSYTSSLPVRKALKELGFRVGASEPVGRRRGGTVATLEGELKPLDPKEDRKLSPFSVPFRDEDLRREPLEILLDYRLSVLLRERELSLGRA